MKLRIVWPPGSTFLLLAEISVALRATNEIVLDWIVVVRGLPDGPTMSRLPDMV